jgi:hypothetical protein
MPTYSPPPEIGWERAASPVVVRDRRLWVPPHPRSRRLRLQRQQGVHIGLRRLIVHPDIVRVNESEARLAACSSCRRQECHDLRSVSWEELPLQRSV